LAEGGIGKGTNEIRNQHGTRGKREKSKRK